MAKHSIIRQTWARCMRDWQNFWVKKPGRSRPGWKKTSCEFLADCKSIARDFSHDHARRRKTEGPGYKRRRAEAAVAIQAGTVFRFCPRPANRAVWLCKHGSFGGENAVNIHGRTIGGEAG